MPKVTFLPMNLTCEARSGERILDVALRHDVSIQHACGGFCACTTCHILLQSGLENVSPPDEDEMERLDKMSEGKEPQSRLACQTQVLQDIVVKVVNLNFHD